MVINSYHTSFFVLQDIGSLLYFTLVLFVFLAHAFPLLLAPKTTNVCGQLPVASVLTRILFCKILLFSRSCVGGVASLNNPCVSGYEGPVCGICSHGYYKQIQSCKECPTKKQVAIQLGIIVASLMFIAAIVMWYSRKKGQKNEGRALIDIVFARLKIIIGFYQVLIWVF